MLVIVKDTYDSMSKEAARIIADRLRRKPNMVLGLATGSTPLGLYRELIRMHKEEGLDFSKVTTFNLDEYVGLKPDNPQSYHAYMREHLFRHVNLNPANTHLPRGDAPDLDAECQSYEQLIAHAGGIDLQLLGIGRSGHIGFNEPLSALRSRTREKALTPTTIKQNAAQFPSEAAVPRRAITMGVGTILDARRCILLATGESKAEIIAKAVEGPITSMITASALQWHPRCTVVVDEAAATRLTEQDYYRWIFANEPEWEAFR
jgi:glucosamine-6-phosphate deaminase